MAGLGPLPASANNLSVKIKGTYSGQPWLNGLFLRHAAGAAPSSADCVSIANQVGAAWGTDLAPLMSTAVELTEITVTDLSSDVSAQGSATFTTAGTRAGTALPTSVACVASLIETFRYRGGHSRIYLPAGVVADITSGRLWAGAFQTAANTALASFLAALNAITATSVSYAAVNVHYFTHDPTTKAKLYRVPPLFFPINSIIVHGRVDTQRRRLGAETP